MDEPRRNRRYLYEDVPVPNRTRYRRRAEERRAAAQQNNAESSDSDEQNFDEGHPNLAHESSASSSETPSNGSLEEGEGGSNESSDNVEDEDHAYITNSSNSSSEEDEQLSDNVESIAESENEEPLDQRPNVHDEAGAMQPLLNQVLCPCTTTTEGDALLMCLALGMRHHLSWVALVDILKFVNKLFGKKVVSASKYYLFKYFDQLKEEDSALVHLYCPECEIYIGNENLNNLDEIHACQCGTEVKLKGPSASYFITANIKKQLVSLMSKPEVAEEIMTYRFRREKLDEDGLEDIYDGAAYQQFCGEDGILSDFRNFSVTINTDGMDLGKSSSRSAWPIFMYINELSPRSRKKHVIFAGVWVGEKTPNMSLFFKPFVDELVSLAEDGFQWRNSADQEIISRVLPLIGIFDSAARFKVLNLSSYNSFYGCTFCYQKTEYFTKMGCRYTIPETCACLRTHDSMKQDMLNYHNSNIRNKKRRIKKNKGCKGFTELIRLQPYFDLGRGVVVDFMHNALLGVTRTLTLLYLESFGKEFYLGAHVKNIDERLKSIRAPRSITRTPRKLKFVKKWKASEWRMFLIFYALLCFDGLLRQKYFAHFSLLSSAFFLLLKKSISRADLETAHLYLRRFVFLNEEYFGKTAMLYNFHQLLHVIEGIKDWGPLWNNNAFLFEGENRHLNQMNTSSGHVGKQLTRRYLTLAAFPDLINKYATTEAAVDFIEEIMEKKYRHFVMCDECVLPGKGVPYTLSEPELQCLENAGFMCENNALSFKRCLYKGILYSTNEFSKDKKNDDSYIRTNTDKRGFIEQILQITIEERSMVVFIVREFLIDQEPVLRDEMVTVTHIKRVDRRVGLIPVQPNAITHQCIFFDLDYGCYVGDIPYGCYGD